MAKLCLLASEGYEMKTGAEKALSDLIKGVFNYRFNEGTQEPSMVERIFFGKKVRTDEQILADALEQMK